MAKVVKMAEILNSAEYGRVIHRWNSNFMLIADFGKFRSNMPIWAQNGPKWVKWAKFSNFNISRTSGRMNLVDPSF